MLINDQERRIIRDILIIVVGAAVTFSIVHYIQIMDLLLPVLDTHPWLTSFVAGTLLVSIFTTIPATALLILLCRQHSLPGVALAGALGSVMGDTIIFSFNELPRSRAARYQLAKQVR